VDNKMLFAGFWANFAAVKKLFPKIEVRASSYCSYWTPLCANLTFLGFLNPVIWFGEETATHTPSLFCHP